MQLIFETLPAGTVEFGHAFTDFKEERDAVSISFEDRPPVQARFVVGADGYFSPVRKALLQDGPPEFAVGSSSPLLLLPLTLKSPVCWYLHKPS